MRLKLSLIIRRNAALVVGSELLVLVFDQDYYYLSLIEVQVEALEDLSFHRYHSTLYPHFQVDLCSKIGKVHRRRCNRHCLLEWFRTKVMMKQRF